MNRITDLVELMYLRALVEDIAWPVRKEEQQVLLSKIASEGVRKETWTEEEKSQLDKVLGSIVNGPIENPTRYESKAEAAMEIYYICDFYEQMFSSEGGCQ